MPHWAIAAQNVRRDFGPFPGAARLAEAAQAVAVRGCGDQRDAVQGEQAGGSQAKQQRCSLDAAASRTRSAAGQAVETGKD